MTTFENHGIRSFFMPISQNLDLLSFSKRHHADLQPHSIAFVGYQERKSVAADVQPIYTAATVEEAWLALELFVEKWDARYPLIAKSWRENWVRIEPMFNFYGRNSLIEVTSKYFLNALNAPL